MSFLRRTGVRLPQLATLNSVIGSPGILEKRTGRPKSRSGGVIRGARLAPCTAAASSTVPRADGASQPRLRHLDPKHGLAADAALLNSWTRHATHLPVCTPVRRLYQQRASFDLRFGFRASGLPAGGLMAQNLPASTFTPRFQHFEI